MNWEAIGALSELTGVVLVVSSLLFVGYQIRQSVRETRAASMNSIMNSWVDFYYRISDDAELSEIIRKGVVDASKMNERLAKQGRPYMCEDLKIFSMAEKRFPTRVLPISEYRDRAIQQLPIISW